MYVPFDQMPDEARVWIYQADQKISTAHHNTIAGILQHFTAQWAAHGEPLRTSFLILDDHFVVLAVDEKYNNASGCSIDSSVHVVKEIMEKTTINFFNREQVAFKIDEGVRFISMKELKRKYEEGVWQGHTQTFNTLASTAGDIRTKWLLPAENSWLKRFIPKAHVMNDQ